MNSINNPNLEILILTVDCLGELVDEMVFLGGCATGLLITDSVAPPIRVTRDVDAIVQVASELITITYQTNYVSEVLKKIFATMRQSVAGLRMIMSF